MKDIFDYSLLPAVYPKAFLKDRVINIRRNGLPKGLFTGIAKLDAVFRLDEARLVTVTGVPGSGKSEFVDYLTTTYNRKYGKKCLYFSPENMPIEMHIEKLLRKYYCRPITALSDEEYDKGLAYLLNNFFFMNTSQYHTLSDIIRTTEEMVKKYGINSVVIDPLNCVEFDRMGAELETQSISRLLDELAGLARKFNLIVFIVAHPKKMEKKSETRVGTEYEIPNAYDINGSAHFFNKSDFVLVVHRKKSSETETIIKVDKVKFTNYGKPGKCEIGYDPVSGNYYDQEPNFDGEEETGDGEAFIPVPFVFPDATSTSDCDPLSVEVSLYSGVGDTESDKTIILKDFLMSDMCKDVASLIRAEKTPEERKNKKKSIKYSIPGVTVSGKFTERNATNIISYSGLMCIDIDYSDNHGVMGTVPDVLHNHPCVVFASKSITGDGYYAIVAIENPEHYTEHFNAIEKEFKDEYGITLDPRCKDVCHLRYGSYDEDPYYNPSAIPYYKEYTLNKEQKPSCQERTATPKLHLVDDSIAQLDYTISQAQKLNVTVADDYDKWQRLAMSISTLGEDGRARFHAVSSLAHNYDPIECDKRYTYVLEKYADKNEFTLATAIRIINEAISDDKNNE